MRNTVRLALFVTLSYAAVASAMSPTTLVSPDTNANGVADLVIVRYHADLQTRAEIRDAGNGALLRTLPVLGSDKTPIDAVMLPDQDGNGIPEIAILATRNSDGRGLVEIRNVSGAAQARIVWLGAGLTPKLIEMVNDADSNGVDEIAVLLSRDSDGRSLVEIKNSFGPTLPRLLWYIPASIAIDLTVVDDADNNGIPEIGVLSIRDSDQRGVVELKNASGATLPNAVWASAGVRPQAVTTVADADGNGVEEVAILSTRDSDARILVEVKNASGPTLPAALWFAAGHTPVTLTVANDVNGNGVPEIALLTRRDSDGLAAVHFKNASGATMPSTVWYPSGYTPLPSLAMLDDVDNNAVDEAGVLLQRVFDGRLLVQKRNSSGPTLPQSVWTSVAAPGVANPGWLGDGQLAALIESVRAKHGVPAMGAVLVKRGRVLEYDSSGRRVSNQNVPVALQDKWHLGSLTKAMTGMLAADLIEDGQLNWTTTPQDVWPNDAPNMTPQFRTVTIAELMAHQSGISNDIFNIPSLNQILDTAPGTVMFKRALWAEELLQQVPNNAVNVYYYSNASYIVAGAMLEEITGTQWETLLTNRIFTPLGMSSSGFGAPGTPGVADQPWGHQDLGGGNYNPVSPGPGSDNQVALGPAGTAHATLADYGKYIVDHVAGELGATNILAPATYQFLHAPLNGWWYGMGWGMYQAPWATNFVQSHDGSNTFWRARVTLIPDHDMGLLVTVNVNDVNAITELNDLLIERLLASP